MNTYVEYSPERECPSVVHDVADFIKDDTCGKGVISSGISKDITSIINRGFTTSLRLSTACY